MCVLGGLSEVEGGSVDSRRDRGGEALYLNV